MDADELIKQLNSILHTAKSMLELCDNTQSYYDKKEQDVLHKIEFEDISESESIALINILKNNRIERRKLKNDHCKYQLIVEIAPTLSKLHKLDKKISEKFYTPKVMPELFKNSNNTIGKSNKKKRKKKKSKLKQTREDVITMNSDVKQFLSKTQDLLERWFDYEDITGFDDEVLELQSTLDSVYGLPLLFESKLAHVFDYLMAGSFPLDWHIEYGYIEDGEWVISEDDALDFISSVEYELEDLMEDIA